MSAYTDFCYGTLLLSVLLNGMLARVANRRHDRIGFYRYFFINDNIILTYISQIFHICICRDRCIIFSSFRDSTAGSI